MSDHESIATDVERSQPHSQPIPLLITVQHAQIILGMISRDTVYRLMRVGKLRYSRIGRMRLITPESLRRVARERGIVL